ncbi:MAG: AMP-binding protein, partial [bacterium]|nr:AMP-binding protein [bacterium]
DDCILQTGNIVFDATTFEIWGALLNGLRLVLVDKNTILDAEKLGVALKEHNVTILWLTSLLFNQISQQDSSIFLPLRYLLVGGDVLSFKHINQVKKNCPRLKIINGYGPTENTTFSTYFHIRETYDGNIPIGTPIANSTAYIVSKYNRMQPVCIPGELLVGGDGLARGYLNRSQLTKEKFITIPAAIHTTETCGTDAASPSKNLAPKNLTLYKTGDLCKRQPDGTIEFLGRIDNQVKIRGYRIELGEIEHQLRNHENVTGAVVIAKDDKNGDKNLLAFYVAATQEEEGEPADLRRYLNGKLPAYMTPTYIEKIHQIPLTPNGKVDKKKIAAKSKNNHRKSKKLYAPTRQRG